MELTKDQLRKVQMTELELLIQFDKVCREHDLQYHLFAGTLLGAVRHKGFIPWDDDVDVCMLRDDYERLLRLDTTEVWGEKYFLQTNQTDPVSILQFAKLRKNNTVFEMSNEISASSHKGMWLDIFPLDNVSDDFEERKKQYKDINNYYAIVTSSMKSRVVACKTPWKKIIRLFLYGITKIIPKQYFDRKLSLVMNKFNNQDTQYATHLTNGTFNNKPERFMIRREEFNNTILFDFEGHKFYGPAAYDSILTKMYGDYMTPPPPEQQVSHHGIVRVKF